VWNTRSRDGGPDLELEVVLAGFVIYLYASVCGPVVPKSAYVRVTGVG
jgi:hypothetical protein